MNRFIFTGTTSFTDLVKMLIKKYEFNPSIITIKGKIHISIPCNLQGNLQR